MLPRQDNSNTNLNLTPVCVRGDWGLDLWDRYEGAAREVSQGAKELESWYGGYLYCTVLYCTVLYCTGEPLVPGPLHRQPAGRAARPCHHQDRGRGQVLRGGRPDSRGGRHISHNAISRQSADIWGCLKAIGLGQLLVLRKRHRHTRAGRTCLDFVLNTV